MRWIAAFALMVQFGYAQQLPDGEALNKLVGDAQKRFKTLQFVQESTMEVIREGAEPVKTITRASAVTERPGKNRIESNVQGITALTVSNGEEIYLYSSFNHQYVRIPAALGPAGVMASFGIKMPDLADIHQSPKTLRDETVEVDGHRYDCWVLENKIGDLSMPVPGNDKVQMKMTGIVTTVWIDKKLSIDVKSDTTMKMDLAGIPGMQMHLQTLKKGLKVDEPVAESMFTFTPPPDAKEVKEMSFATPGLAKADLAGKDAPAFSMKGIDGKTYDLATLRGKTVMLDFWATWCVPCRRSTPAMEKIYAEYKDRGLVVLAVNTGEERELVDGFVKKTPFGYPVTLSGDSGILDAYKITAYPTFVLIGPDGKVIANEIGFNGETMLRGMIGKAAFAGKQ